MKMRGNTSNLRPAPPWQKGQSGNPKGRPKKQAPEILAKIYGGKRANEIRRGLRKEEASEWENDLLCMTLEELRTLAGSETAPAFARGLAIGILFDAQDGSTKTVEKLREWQFGKAVQDLTTKGEKIAQEPLTIEIIDSREQVDGLNE